MAVEAKTAQTNANGVNLRSLLRTWLEPRSTDRDAAFRESIIRSTVGILFLLVLLSFASAILVFQSRWSLISFPSLHVLGLVGFLFAAIAVARGSILAAGWLLVLTITLCAGVFVLLARQESSVTGVLLGVPVLMFAPLLTALVLPRHLILPISLLVIATYGLFQFVLTAGDYTLPGLTAGPQMVSVFLLIFVEGVLLRQLRVEFDARLNAMSVSIEQAKAAQKQAEAARLLAEEAQHRAEESDKAKSQFLANMSHELRTPLNAIIGYDEAMLGGLAGEFQPLQTKLLGHIQYNSRRLLGLINDILDLAKIESGSLQAYLSPMSPHKVVRETSESLRSLADEKGLQFTVQFSEAVPEVVLGDANKLQQVLSNLIGNAINYTDKGSVVVDVSTVDLSLWQIRVIDTGIGMPEGAESYIFEPFLQVDGTEKRKRKGTGLGLAITQRLVAGLGGSIEVDSKLGEGSTFTVKLPRAHVPLEAAESQLELTGETKHD